MAVVGKGTGMCGWEGDVEGDGDVWLGGGGECVAGKGKGMCGCALKGIVFLISYKVR